MQVSDPPYSGAPFTPTVAFQTAGDLSTAFSTQTGRYVRLGDMVFFTLTVVLTTFTYTTSSGDIRIGGLPFVVHASDTSLCHVRIGTNHTWPASVSAPLAVPVAGQQYLVIRGTGSGITTASFQHTHFASGSNPSIIITGFYLAA